MTRVLSIAAFLAVVFWLNHAHSEDAPPSPKADEGTTAAAAEASPTAEGGPFGCEGVVSFKWKPSVGASAETGTPTSEGGQAASFQETAYGTIRATGATEAEGKKAIEAKVPGESARAMSRCRELHENLSGCVAAKFASSASVLSSLSFSARQELERAIQADCQKQVGICIEGKIGTVTCKPLPKTVEKEGEEDEKDSKGGNDKEKSDKKKK